MEMILFVSLCIIAAVFIERQRDVMRHSLRVRVEDNERRNR